MTAPSSVLTAVASAVVVMSAALTGACSPTDRDTPEGHRILEVPGRFATIQDAVDESRSGDVVLIESGIYHESVEIITEDLTVRGVDRNGVILDGQHRLANGFTVSANGVVIENLTAHSFTQNGVVFSSVFAPGDNARPTYGSGPEPLDGYRVSYVTTYNNGLYGIYAFGARHGTIEHSYASGHPSSGFYVGQCKPCDVVLTDLTAERNAIGYYGTNASGGVYLINSVFRANRIGVAPNSQRSELLAPQVETIVVANLVEDNDDPTAPEVPEGLFGVGIAIGGGTRNTVERNLVRGHDGVGILIIELDGFAPQSNMIRDNEVADNTVDLGFDTADGALLGNCFADNVFTTSMPDDIEAVLPCGARPGTPDEPSTPIDAVRVPTPPSPPAPDYRTLPAPPPQPAMPGAGTSAPAPARAPAIPDLASLTRPGR